MILVNFIDKCVGVRDAGHCGIKEGDRSNVEYERNVV